MTPTPTSKPSTSPAGRSAGSTAAGAPMRRATPMSRSSGMRIRGARALAIASLIAIAGLQLTLRWEATGLHALGTITLASGQSFYGDLGQNWSGDLVVRTKDGDTLAVAALSSVSMVGFLQRPAPSAPWRLATGLTATALAVGLALASHLRAK